MDQPDSGLPPAAAGKRPGGVPGSRTWDSALAVDEFAAISSTGFEPVGQVLGAAIWNTGYARRYACPSALVGYRPSGLGSAAGLSRSVIATSGGESPGFYAPVVRGRYEARRAAIGRMTAQCQSLGGHGVVGVTPAIGTFPAGGLEFRAIGTAVRAPGAQPLAVPFTSALTGQDFAKLIMAGWVPAGLVVSISIGARHDDWLNIRDRLGGNAEVSGWARLVSETRHDARAQLEREVAQLGASGAVVQQLDTRLGEHECNAQDGRRDHVVEVTIIGTAIASFGERQRWAQPPLTVMSLNQPKVKH